MNDARLYTIGEISNICSIPIKTLRYYDEIGLISPVKRSETGNYRYYCENQILTLFIIRKLKLLGFSLKEIKSLINESDVACLRMNIEDRMEQIHVEIEKLQGKYTEGKYFLERLKKGHVFLDNDSQEANESYTLDVIPEADVIYTRKIQSDYNNADVSIDRWVEILNLADKNGLTAIGPIVLTYHNEPLGQFYQTDCDLEVCLQVNMPIDLPICKKYGGFKAVTAIHAGSHGTIYNTHINAIKWLKKNKLSINGPISEEYIISPMDVMHEEAYISKVIIPVEER